ncbi:MAG TPA: hypothetical protein VFI91_07215 [Longimicrobiaceae bacterium]|nr:hypothetical protein [Longimicrobiaceae bacterium]
MHNLRTSGLAGAVAFVALLGACGSNGSTAQLTGEVCRVMAANIEMPEDLHETSGVAFSRNLPGVIWSHNDSGGEAEVFALELPGILRARVAVTGAENEDWEDMALGACPAGQCLYLADIGDNSANREVVTVYRVPEPPANATATAPADRLVFSYPGGPRDSEAIFVMPTGELYVISKGWKGISSLYRYPPSAQPGTPVELEHIRDLSDGPVPIPDQITGAGASGEGNWIAVRTYSKLYFYRPAAFLSPTADLDPLMVDLEPLDEGQGEGVDLRGNGVVVLTTEGGPPTATLLRCSLPRTPA